MVIPLCSYSDTFRCIRACDVIDASVVEVFLIDLGIWVIVRVFVYVYFVSDWRKCLHEM
jgi:hypothetical protein